MFARDRLVLSYKIERVSLDLPYILRMRLKELYSPVCPIFALLIAPTLSLIQGCLICGSRRVLALVSGSFV